MKKYYVNIEKVTERFQNMFWHEIATELGIATSTLAKIRKGEPISLATARKIMKKHPDLIYTKDGGEENVDQN